MNISNTYKADQSKQKRNLLFKNILRSTNIFLNEFQRQNIIYDLILAVGERYIHLGIFSFE